MLPVRGEVIFSPEKGISGGLKFRFTRYKNADAAELFQKLETFFIFASRKKKVLRNV